MKEIYKDYLFEKHILVSDEEKEELLARLAKAYS